MASFKELQKVMPLYHNIKIPLILYTRILIFKLVLYFNILHMNITKNSISELLYEMVLWSNEYDYDIGGKL